ncbi:LRR receptor-like serine/threonine-protein kinase FLS2 [Olea europaea subsp. europaea]|uniref:LRR receptor-like serine/threonine-protein kinase FLS2 n=1 Tax=Olea europaea subsp. europaea TaxID=158383 RepID=A0A8S0SS48_OLEEU|nr:LRR receptor-like serine/threonine-protein kinase FLS2 [Olea europaea subsp. europaea]
MSNEGLCRDPVFGLPSCPIGRQKKRRVMLAVVFSLLGITILIVMPLAYAIGRYRRKNLAENGVDFAPGTTLKVSYYELLQATEGYRKIHLIGIGRLGTVYRGTLNNGRDVVMKFHYGSSMPIVHCDLKPSNVLLDEDMVAHLSDFGIAELLGEGESNAYTTTLGTLGYIAPEYGLEESVSIRCDVYSYGIVLMEVFT